MALLPTIKRDAELYAYRVYVTDSLQAIAENTAISAAYCTDGKAGKSIEKRWAELGKPAPPKEARTPEEIIESLKAKADAIREGGG